MPISKRTKQRKDAVKDAIDSQDKTDTTLENIESFRVEEDASTENFSSSDDSDDEVILNRSGNVPKHWYEE